MGVSLPSVIERKNDQLVITARVVVKTSDSEYVDGMDIAFSLDPIIDPNYYQNSPDYHGGSIEDSQPWLKKHGKVILEQKDNPFEAGSLKDLLVDELKQLENNSNKVGVRNDHDDWKDRIPKTRNQTKQV